MDDHTAKAPTQGLPLRRGQNPQSSEISPELALEWERLRLERQKYATEVRLKRREFRQTRDKNVWKDLFTNPVTIAVVGGVITLVTALVTNNFNAIETRRSEE